MGSDPASTLAFAEVTAHLCYALEDIHTSFKHHPDRRSRNEHNRATYLSPVEVSGLSNQSTVERVILSCIGRLDTDTAAPMAERVDRSQPATKKLPNLKDRSEAVDIKYL